MKLEQQVCSLDLAKRLKELGIDDYNCLFHWRYGGKSKPELQRFNRSHTGHELTDNANIPFEWCSAFTVAELGEMLPDCIKDRNGDILFEEMDRDKSDSVYFYNYVHLDDTEDEKAESKLLVSSDTEADARAKMLIYLLENNLTPPTKP